MKTLKSIVYNKANLSISAIDTDNNIYKYSLSDFTSDEQDKIGNLVNVLLPAYKIDNEYSINIGCSQILHSKGERLTFDYLGNTLDHTILYIDAIPDEDVSTDNLNIELISPSDKIVYNECKQIIIDKINS